MWRNRPQRRRKVIDSPGNKLVPPKMSLIAIVGESRCFLSVQCDRQYRPTSYYIVLDGQRLVLTTLLPLCPMAHKGEPKDRNENQPSISDETHNWILWLIPNSAQSLKIPNCMGIFSAHVAIYIFSNSATTFIVIIENWWHRKTPSILLLTVFWMQPVR